MFLPTDMTAAERLQAETIARPFLDRIPKDATPLEVLRARSTAEEIAGDAIWAARSESQSASTSEEEVPAIPTTPEEWAALSPAQTEAARNQLALREMFDEMGSEN